jgi:hypothetical protein
MVGVALRDNAHKDGFDTHFLRKFNLLRHIRQHSTKPLLNKSG